MGKVRFALFVAVIFKEGLLVGVKRSAPRAIQ